MKTILQGLDGTLRSFCTAAFRWMEHDLPPLGKLTVGTVMGLTTLIGDPVRGAAPEPERVVITSPLGTSPALALVGRDSTVQVQVSRQQGDLVTEDLTRVARYEVAPPALAQISSDGLLTPQSEGNGSLRAHLPSGETLETPLTVSHINEDLPINFANSVVPVFSRYGCNGGGCHGKSGGQNGFRLSLLGFEPREDYEYLTQDSQFRRISPAAPDRSLLLRKATGMMPHGGGARLATTDPAYRLLRRWLEQGMPYGAETDPKVERVEVYPLTRTMEKGAQQQLSVVAVYTDGSREDVTRMTHFECNEPDLAEVSDTGLVTAAQRTGRGAVMARFQTFVGVFRVTVPLGQQELTLPAPQNFVDELVFANLRELGLPVSERADDSTFLRRATIDIAGRLPTLAESEAFLTDTAPDKRAQLIDRLLESPDYADYFAKKWADILRNRRSSEDRKPLTFAFHDWLRTQLITNLPYDRMVRQIVAAAGPVDRTPPVAWYHEVKEVEQQVEDTAQLFLGMRIQCARCHHHPQERWSQADYYGLAAFFSQVGRKASPTHRQQFHIHHRTGLAQATHPKTGEALRPTPLGHAQLNVPADRDPRQELADWLAHPDNPYFARALVNRYWKHFFSRGLVEPEDDMRVTNPPSNPELLDGLAEYFIASGFDLKGLVRILCNSETYQRSALPNAYNQQDEQNYSRFLPRRLPAEVLSDAVDTVTNNRSGFGGVPASFRAVQLPDNAFDSYFLTVFGRPQAESACECERSSDVSLAQTLHLINSQSIQQKLRDGRPKSLADAQMQVTHAQRIRELYLITFAREPSAEESQAALAYLERKQEHLQEAYEDIVWAVLNTKEFLFNH